MTQFLNSYYSPYQERLASEYAEANKKPITGEEVLEGIGSAFSNFNTVGSTIKEAERNMDSADYQQNPSFEITGEEYANLSLKYDKDEIGYLEEV